MHIQPAMRHSALALLCLAYLLGTHAQTQIRRRELDQSWVNQPTGFFRRWIHSSVTLGDYLYIDGGVIVEKVNDSIVMLPVNQTYSVPLSTSWDPSTIEMKRIDKGDSAPVYNRPNLWPAADNSSFYSFNGDLAVDLGPPHANPPSSPELWQFKPDGNGGGMWQLYSTTDSVIQSASVSVTSGNGSAYLLGGFQNWRTSRHNYPNTEDAQSADGLVSYDMTSGTWLNQSITYSFPNGWIWDAHLHYLTGIGHEGNLLLAMGGDTTWPGAVRGDTVRVSYDTVAVYNTVTGDWRNQTTTGNMPPGHEGSCSVGIRDDATGTFEIFLYGGYIGASPDTQSQVNIDLAQNVYVLSLPSFTWHKSTKPYPDQTARSLHTCQTYNRQMLIIGGIEPSIAREKYVADPLPQGIGIFDLTEMQFKSTYDSSVGSYQTPKQIKDYLYDHGQYPRQWNDDKVELWVTGKVTGKNATTVSSPTPTPSPTQRSSSNTGAIAGGVVGGVVGALLLAAVVWLIRRRRPRTPSQEHQYRSGFEKQELEGKNRYNHSDDRAPPRELQNSSYPPRELSGRQVQEMEGSYRGHELPTKGTR